MDVARAFISIPIPHIQKMDSVKDELREFTGLSISNESHITLQFLGDVEMKKLQILSERMKIMGENKRFTIRLKGIGAFPDKKKPRVIWIGAEPADVMKNISNELRRLLDELSIEYDRKEFRAHVTIARVREARPRLTEFIELNRELEVGSFECEEVFLMKSVLTSKGAMHSVISSVPLHQEGPL